MKEEDFASLKRGLAQAEAMLAGQDVPGAVVHTPEQIAARRKGGRPAGSVKADAKQQVTIRLDADLLAHFRAGGPGWQTRINDALKQAISRQE